MKKYYASELGNKNQELNEYFDKVLKKEKVVVYGFNTELNVDSEKDGVIFVDDIGRGGGTGGHEGEIYAMMKYMVAIMLGGVIQGATYDLFKKSYPLVKRIFKRSKKIGEIFHYFIQSENNSQYHFVFFSFIGKDDFKNAHEAIPEFIRKNELRANEAVDCYFDTKSKKWHIVGERELDEGYDGKYLIY